MKKVAAVVVNPFMFEVASQHVPEQAGAACWNCGDAEALLECARCQAIQPPQRLDPFSRLGLPVSLDLDHEDLLAAYRTQLMIVHPDRHLQKSLREQTYAQQQAAEISHAFRLLQDFTSRAEQVMQVVWGHDEAGDEGSSENEAMDPAVVQELFALQDVAESDENGDVLTMLQDKLAQSEATVRAAFHNRDRLRLRRELQRYRALDRFQAQHGVNIVEGDR